MSHLTENACPIRVSPGGVFAAWHGIGSRGSRVLRRSYRVHDIWSRRILVLSHCAHQSPIPPLALWRMILADRVAQSRVPFAVKHNTTGREDVLNNTADCAETVARCPLRFVLSDELTRLCTALAYSKGSRTLDCADLLRVPATSLWLEWCKFPWEHELSLYGFAADEHGEARGGRRGALIHASPDGRRGTVRTFWTDGPEGQALASCVEAYFDFDVPHDEEPEAPDGDLTPPLRVVDRAQGDSDLLSRCFRFRYERSWRDYYDRAALSRAERCVLDHRALGTVAIAVPVIMAFLLMLTTRSGLPRRVESFERLNRIRAKAGKAILLDHIKVCCPLMAPYREGGPTPAGVTRRRPRLHHVRGHLFRRGNELHWRVPHLRGSARAGTVRTRTVTWTVDPVAAY
jgi:hypothetical protein